MQEHVPRLPFAVDPLIAEAKRRRRRRWLLVAIAIGVTAAATIGVERTLLSPSHRLTAPPVSRFGIARIPGMTIIASGHSPIVCTQYVKSLNDCDDQIQSNASGSVYTAKSSLDQVWVNASALTKIGERRLRAEAFTTPPPDTYDQLFSRWALERAVSLPAQLIQRHSGALEVQVRVRTGYAWNPRRGALGWGGNHHAAEQLLHHGLIGLSGGDRFVSLPGWTINGGLAGQLNTPLFNGGMTRYQFAWAAGPRVVLVDVLGANLTVREAQRVAALAGPSTG